MLIFYNLIQGILFLSLIFAIFGVISRHFLMEKIFNLIAVFIILAFWLMLYGFEFLPLVILLLYVGAIAVLFLFVVIIVNPDYSEILEDKKLLNMNWKVKNQQGVALTYQEDKNVINSNNIYFNLIFTMQSLLYYIVGTIFVVLVSYFYDFYSLIWLNNEITIITPIYNSIMVDILYVANLLYHDFGLSFLIVGFMLLVSIVGVILLTVKKSTGLKRQNISVQFFRYR